MASRLYTVEEVVANMQDLLSIPGPVEDNDEWSEDEFDGYVDEEEEERSLVEQCSSDEGREGEVNAGREEIVSIPPFASTPGGTHGLRDGIQLDFFRLLVDDKMIDNIVEQTCLYAHQFIQAHELGPRSRVHQWDRQEFNKDELKKFLALIVVMGLINLPQIEDHWVTSWPYCSQAFSKVI